MIKVVIKRNSQGNIVEFSIEGHANYAKHGQDIVCSAVSVLGQTTLLGLNNYANINCQFKIDNGYLYCRIPCEISSDKKIIANAILETMFIGLKNIKEGYSSYINLEEEEV